MKKRTQGLSVGQAAYYEQMMEKQEMNMRRTQAHKMNITRKQRQAQEYKLLLADKLAQKEQRMAVLKMRQT